MPKNSRKDSIGSHIGLAIIAVVLVIFAGYYGYAIYKQNQIDNYNKSVQDIILKTSKKNVKLNPYLRNFVVVPEQAKKFVPKFEKAAANTKEAASELKAIEPPKQFETKHRKLTKYNDKILIEYSNSLTKHLRDFQKTLAGNDIYKIQMALYYIQLDYAKNWQKAFFSSDKKALKDYEGRVKAVQKVTF